MPGRRAKAPRFKLAVGRDGVQLDIDETFWDNTFIDEYGTTRLDSNIAQVVQEIRAALYFLGTNGPQH